MKSCASCLFLPVGPWDSDLRCRQSRPPLSSASPALAGGGPALFPQYIHNGQSRTWGHYAKITRQGHHRRRTGPSWTRASSSDAPGPFLPSNLPPAPGSLSPALWTGCGAWLGSWPLGTGLPAPGVDVVPACTLSVPPGVWLRRPSPGRAFLARLPPERAELPGRTGAKPVTCGHGLFHI